ncbi:MAG TPA: hypothetical protein VFW35_04095 [Sphingomicrobium sp.]|nr:hypothetical protein [Sphingomicrobium sp.]
MLLIGASALVAVGSAVSAKKVQTGTPAQVQRLMNCRAIAAADQRLACYDREAAAMQQAITNQDLFMVDKERARAAGRSLFGFSIPNFGGLFGSNGEISQIEATIKSAGHNSDGGWLIALDDGSVWTQTDDWPGLDARPGKKVIVKRGVLGSFWLSIPGQNGIKVKRIG